ncbi:MAG TPA: ECF-type sigma factor [Bryobacteraceae bacterium]|nr:ECF-type sigma factor [Bryobacteraceae bacterium]
MDQESVAGSLKKSRDVHDVDRAELDQVFSLAYEELKSLAAAVRRSHPSAPLSPTTMVNEAWLKLARTPAVAHTSPLHFRRIAACAMRQVLVSEARRRHALKRGQLTGLSISLEEGVADRTLWDDQVLALDEALVELSRLNARQAQMVESRFFGGLEMREIADLLDVSEATLLRDWRAARAWLAGRLSGAE